MCHRCGRDWKPIVRTADYGQMLSIGVLLRCHEQSIHLSLNFHPYLKAHINSYLKQRKYSKPVVNDIFEIIILDRYYCPW
jgi:hypothetical protein